MLFQRRSLVVKERVAVLKLTDTYDLFAPETGQAVGLAREEPGAWAKYGRLLVNKQLLPTRINVYETEGMPPVLSLRKKAGLFRHKVVVTDSQGAIIGRLQSKVFSLGGGFFVLDAADNRVGEVKGDWKGWNFKLISSTGAETGVITKTWAGLGKELFTSADNYVVSVPAGAPGSPADLALVLAVGLAIDIVFKERK